MAKGDDWASSSDADLRALGRSEGDVEAMGQLVRRALRRGTLPDVGREVANLPDELRDALAAARVQAGRCAWCGGIPHRLRKGAGPRACCCSECYLEVGVLCFHCPRKKAEG